MFILKNIGITHDSSRLKREWRSFHKSIQHIRPGFIFNQELDSKLPERVLTQFKIKSIEYGNWTSQGERYQFFLSLIVSLQDLSQYILKTKNIGFDTHLGIAYGARGQGGSAMAHFEPSTLMINLTKDKGFGAFAHEYGHALDYFLGGYIEQDKGSFSLSHGGSATRIINTEDMPPLRYAMNNIINTALSKKDGAPTDFYLRIVKSKGDYWYRRTEVFARIFEQYVRYVLNKNKIKNVFLTSSKYTNKYYLTDKEFKEVLPFINLFMNEVRRAIK